MPLPAGTCDTHFHVFGDSLRHPFDPRRNYTPAPAPLSRYREVMRAFGIDRAVLVQPSVYGTDNLQLLDALQEGGPAFRGVAVPRADIDIDALQAMHAQGVRGIRLNVLNPAVLGVDDALRVAKRAAHLGWHLQLHVALARPDGVELLAYVAERSAVPLVIDHMGRVGPDTPIPDRLLDLLERGSAWVKLSAPYRLSGADRGDGALLDRMRTLVNANPERILWGTDWPHTEMDASPPSTAALVDLVASWLPDPTLRRQVCVDNPARLYGYPDA